MIVWKAEAYSLLEAGNYEEVAKIYEQAIEKNPDVITDYWYLGLAYLLQGEEESAQSTWLFALMQSDEEGSQELVKILRAEIYRQETMGNIELCWLLRLHLRELDPNLLDNLLHLIKAAIAVDKYTPEQLEEWEVVPLLQATASKEIQIDLLLEVLSQIVQYPYPSPITIIAIGAILPHIPDLKKETCAEILTSAAADFSYGKLENRYPYFAADIVQLCMRLNPQSPDVLNNIFACCIRGNYFQSALEVAKTLYSQQESIIPKVCTHYQVLQAILSIGAWLKIQPVAQEHLALLEQVSETEVIEPKNKNALILAASPLAYIQDKPDQNRRYQNKIAQLFQKNINEEAREENHFQSNLANSKEVLKIGYLSNTLRRHSVGWLSRWLFHYHDHAQFQTSIYLINQFEDEFTRTWFREKADSTQNLPLNAETIAAQIQQDEIDILVDLDSMTSPTGCQVMAMKPAPIQVTWLGFDASGIPAIDYFIADPYVLPDNAQDYYAETIWRLPHTYVAVDGFEVGVPSLRRDQLNIPSDAVIYWSAQRGYKRHPDTTRLQIKIIKAVSNSYLCIKGLADQSAIQDNFIQIAQEEGVNPDRLRFLPIDQDELTHRANLGIADVVLDTYPYNGATTTLETLWMGVPLVTRVGEQFSARNSYTFMINAGITEGIARTDEQYLEWGIRLGENKSLRQQISWRLQQSRKTSPLWNARQFTQEMEKAYQQMWQKYLKKLSIN